MPQINYPVTLRGQFFDVVEVTGDGTRYSLPDWLISSRKAADDFGASFITADDSRIVITEHDRVYYAHCVVCGEHADQDDYAHLDWRELLETVSYAPGWLATSEQLVFCPHHADHAEG